MHDTSASDAATRPRSLTDPRVLIPLSLLALYVIWGSTYLGIRFALESYPPFLLAGIEAGRKGGQLDRDPVTFVRPRACRRLADRCDRPGV